MCCPLVPLLPDGEGYPPNFELPKRQRNVDSLDIPTLTKKFRESLIYEKNNDNCDLCVLGVLSPYSTLSHVMVLELSPNRFLPGPESFSENEWANLTNIAFNVVESMKNTDCSTICCGFNWSPYSWGRIEERGGCQSISTKFHLMIWNWPNVSENLVDLSTTSPRFRFIFSENKYNIIFAKLLAKRINSTFPESDFKFEFSPRGLFIPIPNISKSFLEKLRDVALTVQNLIYHLNEIIMIDSINDIKEIMKNTAQRNLTLEEIELMRKKPSIRSLSECLDKCKLEEEKELIKVLYDAMINRATNCDENKDTWAKCFGFSLAYCETKEQNSIKSGLYIGLHALCGGGGCAELLGCYLTRPEARMADEKTMIHYNHEIWKIRDYLLSKT